MSRFLSVTIMSSAIVCLGLGIPHSWAQTSQPTEAPATTAGVRPYVVKVNMKPEQMQALVKIMHSNRDNCYLQDLDPGDDSSLVLICGIEPATETFAP
jgi:hypothetical protein